MSGEGAATAAAAAAAAPGGKDIWALLVDAQARGEVVRSRAAAEAEADGGADSKARRQAGGGREPRVVFVGEAGSGKTTLLQACLPRGGGGGGGAADKAPAPTTALDYRHARVGAAETLAHYWELGGGRALVKLLEIAVTSQSVEQSMVCVVLDLSRPHLVPDSLVYWLKRVRSHATSCLKKLAKSDAAAPSRAKARAEGPWKAHADRPRVNPSLVPLTIVAARYDQFRSQDAECLRVMARTLRCVAHTYGASLVYAAADGTKAGTQALRGAVARHVAGTAGGEAARAQLDHTRAVAVPAAADSFEAIGSPPAQFAGKASSSPAQAWINACRHYFPAPKDGPAPPKDGPAPPPALEPEPAIDSMLAQKNEDLVRIQREAELQRKLRVAGTSGRR